MSTDNPQVPAPREPAREAAQLPWEGKARRVDILCWGGITLSGIYALALLPLVPSLIGTNPVLLELLRGSTTAMVSAGAFARVGDASLYVNRGLGFGRGTRLPRVRSEPEVSLFTLRAV